MALLKDLIVQGSSRLIGDVYANDIKSGTFYGNLAGGAKGSIPYQSAANTTTLLGIGSEGLVLKVNSSGIPAWSSDSAGVTSIETGTGLTGGTITSTGTISINSTYQDYISHGESAYNALSGYLPLTGGTMSNTNLVTNLNADFLDDHDSTYFAEAYKTYGGDGTFANGIDNHNYILRDTVGSVGFDNTSARIRVYEPDSNDAYPENPTYTFTASNVSALYNGTITSSPFYTSPTGKKVKLIIDGTDSTRYLKGAGIYIRSGAGNIPSSMKTICNGTTSTFSTYGSWHIISLLSRTLSTITIEINTTKVNDSFLLYGLRNYITNPSTLRFPGIANNSEYANNSDKLDGIDSTGFLRWGGSASNVTAMSWGTLTTSNGYTILSHASSSDGGDMGFCNKSGLISMLIDGYFYQNEGSYRVVDTSDLTNYYNKTSSDNRYVLKSGDSMTGSLTTPSLTVTGASSFSQAINGSILGNASTASRWLNARTFTIGSTSKSVDGSGNVSWSLSEIGVTDEKVSQIHSSTNSNFEVLFSGTADNTDRTEGAKKNSNLLFNPSTGNLLTTKLNGVTIGNSPKFTDTTYLAGDNIDIDGTTISALGYLYDGSSLHEFVQGAIDSHTMSGEYSHAEGRYTTAGGDYSHTEGLFTTTTNEYEHAEGIYNLSHYTRDWGGKGTIFSVGTGEEAGKESNAIEILNDNSIYVHGVGKYEPNAGVDIDNAKTLQEVISESFDYTNLVNKPSINNATYSVKTNVSGTVTTVSDFTANQSSADDVTFVQGTNVTITPDATNRKITISATDTKTTLAPSSTDATYPLLACSVADASTSQTTTSIFDSNLKVNPYYHSLVLGAFGSTGGTSEITASGSGSIAFGATNYGADIIASATGAVAHGYAQGGSITASGESSHAEGCGTTASGNYSHAEGYYTDASGAAAHAEGEYTVANLRAMLAVGKYNTNTNTSGYLFVVGNGTSNTRSDAFRVTSSGNCYASGAFYASSDIRKKTILSEIPLDKAYELVNKCQAVFYNWKNDDTKKLEIGLIAQEVKEYFPELVYEGGDGYLALDYSKLTVILLTVIKDLSNKVNKIDLLEKRLNSLENK